MIEFPIIPVKEILAIFIVFCRVGSALMIFPGIGEIYVPPRVRLLIALSISFFISTLVSSKVPVFPDNNVAATMLIAQEIIIGVFLATVVKILINIMSTAGSIIATQTGLGSASLFDPNQGTQGLIVGNFLGLIALLLIFETGIQYVFIEGMIQSYDLFKPLAGIQTDLMSEMIVKTVGGSFEVALKISSPHIAIGLMMFLAGGILSRLMPAMQIFFILVPAQLLIGFFIMMVTLSATMWFFMDYITETLQMIF